MIRLENVSKIHRRGTIDVPALRGVSCVIETGSMTFVIGPSGSGKSTLLCLVGGLEAPTGGDVLIDGRRLADLSPRERDAFRRDDVGFIFQSFNLLSNLSAVDNVLVPFVPQGVTADRRGRAVELLRQVGLGERLEHRPHELSGGEQQRVAIARALLKRPALVLADEPTGELDSVHGAEIFTQLRRLRDELGSTVLVATHDSTRLVKGDRVLTLRDGQLVGDAVFAPAIETPLSG